jgi:archaellum component FlaC
MSQESVPQTRSRSGSQSGPTTLTAATKRPADPIDLNDTLSNFHAKKTTKMGEKVTLVTLSKQLESLLQRTNDNQEKLDMIPEIRTSIDKVAGDIEALTIRTTTLEDQVVGIHNQLQEVKADYTQLSTDLNFVQQTSLKNHFTIRGLPGDIPKNLALKVATTLGTVAGLHLTSEDFSQPPFVVYHRDKKESHIIAAFHDSRTKNTLFAKFKENQPITIEDVCDGLDPQSPYRGKKVLLKNLLTRANQQLLYEARQFTDLFLFVWESNGRILARRTENSPPTHIQSRQHLLGIIKQLRAGPGENNQMNISNTN